jgi:hypothetical protein
MTIIGMLLKLRNMDRKNKNLHFKIRMNNSKIHLQIKTTKQWKKSLIKMQTKIFCSVIQQSKAKIMKKYPQMKMVKMSI